MVLLTHFLIGIKMVNSINEITTKIVTHSIRNNSAQANPARHRASHFAATTSEYSSERFSRGSRKPRLAFSFKAPTPNLGGMYV